MKVNHWQFSARFLMQNIVGKESNCTSLPLKNITKSGRAFQFYIHFLFCLSTTLILSIIISPVSCYLMIGRQTRSFQICARHKRYVNAAILGILAAAV